jgi:hypothetical protein
VGTTAPRDAFHVAFNEGNGVLTGYAVQNLNATGYSGMLFYDQKGALGQFQGFNNTTHEYRINNIASGGSINFMIGSSSKFKVATNGNVGLGVASPASKLDVAGGINLTGTLKMGGVDVLRVIDSELGGSTAVGKLALQSNSNGFANTGVGESALSSNSGGISNTAVGTLALTSNTIGSFNTAIGAGAMQFTTGSSNTAIGMFALAGVTTGTRTSGSVRMAVSP